MQNKEKFLASFRELLTSYVEQLDNGELDSISEYSQEKYWDAVHKALDLELKVHGNIDFSEQYLYFARKIANELFESKE